MTNSKKWRDCINRKWRLLSSLRSEQDKRARLFVVTGNGNYMVLQCKVPVAVAGLQEATAHICCYSFSVTARSHIGHKNEACNCSFSDLTPLCAFIILAFKICDLCWNILGQLEILYLKQGRGDVMYVGTTCWWAKNGLTQTRHFNEIVGHTNWHVMTNYIFDVFVPHDLHLLFVGQIFETTIFQKFIHDHLTNDDIYMAQVNIAINRKSYVGYWLTYLHLILAHSKDHGRCHVYFDSKYLKKVTDMATLLLMSIKMKCSGYHLAYLHLNLDNSESQGQGRTHFDSKNLGNGER